MPTEPVNTAALATALVQWASDGERRDLDDTHSQLDLAQNVDRYLADAVAYCRDVAQVPGADAASVLDTLGVARAMLVDIDDAAAE